MYGKHREKLALARQSRVQTKLIRGDAGDLRRARETFGLLVEATGSPTGLALAQRMTEPRGTLVLKSTFHGAVAVETWPIVVKELNVVGSRCGPFDKAISFLRAYKVDPRPLVTRTFPLKDASAAITFAQECGVMKVLLRNE
jgi:threonine dehydrogenase-like Zn-dependent dehydrogenase